MSVNDCVIELSCGDLPVVENAENATAIRGTFVGNKATYTCVAGYKMTGESTVECLANQQWSTPPICNRE